MNELLDDPREVDALLARLRAENELLRRDVERHRRQAERDPVTGLFSRAHFDWRLEHEWARARTFWTPLSLVVVAVDGWHEARERLGGRTALALVRAAAGIVGSACREVDVVCRTAEDRFAVILPHTNRTGAEAVTSRIEELWHAATLPSAAFEVDARLVVGTAVAFDVAQSAGELLLRAEQALERALSDGAADASQRPTEPHRGRATLIDAA